MRVVSRDAGARAASANEAVALIARLCCVRRHGVHHPPDFVIYLFGGQRTPSAESGKGRVVENFIKHFAREGEGVWACVEPVELLLPSGRIQVTAGTRFTRGTVFMGVELAKLLDEQYALQKRNDCPSVFDWKRPLSGGQGRLSAIDAIRTSRLLLARAHAVLSSQGQIPGGSMADDTSKRGTQDRDRINLNEDYEVRDWAKSLGVSEDQLRSAVAKAGPMVKDVKAHLQRRD